MQLLTLQNYTQNELPQLVALLEVYRATCPNAKVMHPEFYTYHPALEQGKNVFCVMGVDQQMVGFAPLFPAFPPEIEDKTSLQDIWTILVVRPGLAEATAVRELLFGVAYARAEQLKLDAHLTRVRLASDLIDSQQAEIDFLLQKGFTPFEDIYVMHHEAAQPLPRFEIPARLTFQVSKLETANEQAAYVKVFNTCFPENPKSVATLQFLLKSPLWTKGGAMMVYADDELIGSVLVFVDEAVGVVDDVMVLPAWRGQNLAKCLVGEGVKALRAQGHPTVRLEVKATNAPAVAVYLAMGFQVVNRVQLLGKVI